MLIVVDLAQERQRLVGAQLAGAGHEGADVLRQAAAAEAEAGVEELAADPVVVADRVGQAD